VFLQAEIKVSFYLFQYHTMETHQTSQPVSFNTEFNISGWFQVPPPHTTGKTMLYFQLVRFLADIKIH
jgi:hypothetical protein